MYIPEDTDEANAEMERMYAQLKSALSKLQPANAVWIAMDVQEFLARKINEAGNEAAIEKRRLR
jgi:hypothetical protein